MLNGYVYGPFQSRRLGLSLGINVLGEKKRCTFNCVYCEIGASRVDEVVDTEFRYDKVDLDQFKQQVRLPLQNLPEIDSATFGYMGETTLCAQLEPCLDIVKTIKAGLPRGDGGPAISIFTNSTTLHEPAVARVLARFDLVMAKLDCATPALYSTINRPHPSVPAVGEIIENVARLSTRMRDEGHGKLAVQTLLFRSMDPRIPSNVDDASLEDLIDAYEIINPHLIQVYTVARQPAEKGIHAITPVDKERVRAIITRRLGARSIDVRVY